jgi:hypothetical protein
MDFFRSALLRRIIYAIAIALALTRLSSRSHSEPLSPAEPGLPPAFEESSGGPSPTP